MIRLQRGHGTEVSSKRPQMHTNVIGFTPTGEDNLPKATHDESYRHGEKAFTQYLQGLGSATEYQGHGGDPNKMHQHYQVSLFLMH